MRTPRRAPCHKQDLLIRESEGQRPARNLLLRVTHGTPVQVFDADAAKKAEAVEKLEGGCCSFARGTPVGQGPSTPECWRGYIHTEPAQEPVSTFENHCREGEMGFWRPPLRLWRGCPQVFDADAAKKAEAAEKLAHGK